MFEAEINADTSTWMVKMGHGNSRRPALCRYMFGSIASKCECKHVTNHMVKFST